MKLSDYVAQFLKSKGVDHVFGLQGGAVVHLFDSVERTPGMQAIYTHHEQSAALAAVSYSRVTGNTGAVIITTGPGATNAVTGLLAGWQDSIPCFFISGQTRREHTSYGRKVRQVGTQEFPIVDIVRPMTKYAKFIDKVEGIEDELEKAYQISVSGRPGPVWLDIPVNLQWENFEPRAPRVPPAPPAEKPDFSQVAEYLRASTTPLVVAGHGIRSGKAVEKFQSFIKRHDVPFVTTWTAADYLQTCHPRNTGILGISGQRGANKAVHTADLLLVLGSHLSIPQTSTLFDQFAPQAKKILVDIDRDQVEDLNIRVDLPIVADVNDFFEWAESSGLRFRSDPKWIEQCGAFKAMNSVQRGLEQSAVVPSRGMNSYAFNDIMTRALPNDVCMVVDGGGTALYTGFQSSQVRETHRLVCSSAMSAMGTGLAESIGACFATGRQLTTCIIGDGSFLMNVQELQTIVHHKLPIKVFVINNDGYLAIRHTQASFLEGRFAGTSPEGGLSFPEIKGIAEAFGVPYFRVSDAADAPGVVKSVLERNGPVLCEVITPADQDMLFKQGYRKNPNGTFSPMALAEMWPYTA